MKVRLIYQGQANEAEADNDDVPFGLAKALDLDVKEARELLEEPGNQLGEDMDLGPAGKLTEQLRALGLKVEVVKIPEPPPAAPETKEQDQPAASAPPVVSGTAQVPGEQAAAPQAGPDRGNSVIPEMIGGTDMARARLLAEELQDVGHPSPYSHAKPPPPPAEEAATKACPFCAETILAAAIKCKHCGEFLQPRPAELQVPTSATETVHDTTPEGEPDVTVATPPATPDIVQALNIHDKLELSDESKALLDEQPVDEQPPPESAAPAAAAEAPRQE